MPYTVGPVYLQALRGWIYCAEIEDVQIARVKFTADCENNRQFTNFLHYLLKFLTFLAGIYIKNCTNIPPKTAIICIL